VWGVERVEESQIESGREREREKGWEEDRQSTGRTLGASTVDGQKVDELIDRRVERESTNRTPDVGEEPSDVCAETSDTVGGGVWQAG
jgi:hypothetical protein